MFMTKSLDKNKLPDYNKLPEITQLKLDDL